MTAPGDCIRVPSYRSPRTPYDAAVQVRRAAALDSEQIRKLYNVEVLASTATLDLVPRSPEEQESWMAAHGGVYPVIVADDEGEIVGFASLSAYRPRPGYATAVEDSIYIAEGRRREGLGRALLTSAIETARTHGFHSVVARIVAEQEASVGLHRACGFELVGVEREIGRKFGRWLDVAILQQLL